jgi:hypothetical protein
MRGVPAHAVRSSAGVDPRELAQRRVVDDHEFIVRAGDEDAPHVVGHDDATRGRDPGQYLDQRTVAGVHDEHRGVVHVRDDQVTLRRVEVLIIEAHGAAGKRYVGHELQRQ